MIYYILAACILYIVSLAYFFLPSPYVNGSKFAKKNQSVAILVLGDIGRSPRMQYHALSLSKAGFKVHIIGYKGAEPHRSLLGNANIKYDFVPDVPEILLKRPGWQFPFIAPFKVLHQLFFLFLILGYSIDPPAYVLVQNPPSIPSLGLSQLICFLRNSRLVIDWHNLGYSILALKMGANHPMVAISTWYEQFFGKFAFAHFTVTASMHKYISNIIQAKGKIETLYDRPPAQFERMSTVDRISFLGGLAETKDFDPTKDKLVVSSTSWTADEDFQLLLDALGAYDSADSAKPNILAIITGKGPLKNYYLNLISKLKLRAVTIRCVWLSAEDYPKMIACADLGISLHSSSSGLDLPMKVVDMFGCGLPVLALRFACIHELVTEGLNGRTFADAEDLAQCLEGLFSDAEGRKHLATLRHGAEEEGKRRWDDEWEKVARPIFQKRE